MLDRLEAKKNAEGTNSFDIAAIRISDVSDFSRKSLAENHFDKRSGHLWPALARSKTEREDQS